jgi:catechol 2,3-dioxygenase-like lactoylglutathione lyase family enzyme
MLIACLPPGSMTHVTSRLSEIVLDAHDPEGLAAFWCEVLGWSVVDRYDGQVEIGASAEEQQGPTLVFMPSSDTKNQKLRLHVDVRPVDGDHEAELQRLLGIGAVRVDVGQGDATWAVLADPEGNEFCLLHPVGQLDD